MKRLSLKQTLISRDNISPEEANEWINNAREAMYDYLAAEEEEAAYDVCSEYFGLEPDYLDDLI